MLELELAEEKLPMTLSRQEVSTEIVLLLFFFFIVLFPLCVFQNNITMTVLSHGQHSNYITNLLQGHKL